MNRFARIAAIAWAALAIPARAHDPGLTAGNLQVQRDQIVVTSKEKLEWHRDGQRLEIRAPNLTAQPHGYRFFLSVTDAQGQTLATKLLSATDDRLEVMLAKPVEQTSFATFLKHGVMHILTGYDHLLFIGALALAVVSFRDLIKVITAFTLAHTVTLTLSVFNIVRLPSHIVEPMIAGSIVFVALTNVFWPERSRGKLRLATAFFFGLFHGLGFAGGLLDAMEGLPGMSIGLAILAFSLGVELGHQLIVLPVFGAKRLVPTWPVLRYASAAISVAGVWYFVAAVR
ncbi:MAG: HupE/UreJ family protein [Verrucomicrobiota bacterium]